MRCLLTEECFRFCRRVLDLPCQMEAKLVCNVDVWTGFIDVGEPVLHIGCEPLFVISQCAVTPDNAETSPSPNAKSVLHETEQLNSIARWVRSALTVGLERAVESYQRCLRTACGNIPRPMSRIINRERIVSLYRISV